MVPTTVRAKFWVESVEQRGDVYDIALRAVYEGSEENKRFFKMTPAGFIQLSTVNAEAAAQFAQGAEMYIDFTPVKS